MVDEKGQALLETLIVLPIFLLLLAGIVWFTQTLIIQTRLLMAARYGVWLLTNQPNPIPSLQHYREEFVVREMGNMLVYGKPKFNRKRLQITCARGDIFSPDRVEVAYGMSPFFNPGGKLFPPEPHLREHCELLAGTWYLGWPGN